MINETNLIDNQTNEILHKRLREAINNNNKLSLIKIMYDNRNYVATVIHNRSLIELKKFTDDNFSIDKIDDIVNFIRPKY